MQDVDFLPAEYRQRHARQRRQVLRNLTMGAAGLLVVLVAFHQHRAFRLAERELAAVKPQYQVALQQTQQLGQLQAELLPARAEAELFVYLRHPWPRSQIISALLAPLPDEVCFTLLEIRRRTPPVRSRQERAFPVEQLPEAGTPQELPPASRDLQHFRQRFDKAETVVAMQGITTDIAAVHRYLGDLNRARWFLRAELESLEADRAAGQSMLQFQATLVVRPGYGLPGGPSRPPQHLVAATSACSPNPENSHEPSPEDR